VAAVAAAVAAATLAPACGGGGGSTVAVEGGTQLLAGDLDVLGLTGDDVAAVLDQASGALAVPLDGSAAQVVDAASDVVVVNGRVIASLHNLDLGSRIGDLTLWTAATGPVAFAADSTGAFAVSDDGASVMATAASSSDGTTTTLVVGRLDGSPAMTVATASRDNGCAPRIGFAGGRFLFSHCAPGATSVAISSVDPAAGTVTDLLTGAQNLFVVVPAASPRVVVVAADGSAQLVAPDGTGATPLAAGVTSVIATADGSAILLASGGALVRVPTDGGASATVVPSGVASVHAVSPDGSHVLFRSGFGPRNGYGDLLLASATEAAPVTTLATTLDATTFGDPFTLDGSRALYITQANDQAVGVLETQAVDGGRAAVLGHGVWVAWGYRQTGVVLGADFASVPERPGRVTIQTRDAAAGGGDQPTTIAANAGADFFLTAARDRVVLSVPGTSGAAGLYVAPLP
jgi:hypothetical protein